MGVRNVQLPPDTRCKAAILLRLITLLLLATEFNEPPGHRGLLKLCTFSLILWPLEQFVCFLPSHKVFKSGFNQTLGFVTQLPSIPILFYEKKGWSSSPADLNRVVWELLAGHACVYQHIWVPAQMNVKVDVSCGCWLECVMRVQAEHSHGSASALLGHTFPPFSLPATLFLSTFRGTGHLAWRGRWWG